MFLIEDFTRSNFCRLQHETKAEQLCVTIEELMRREDEKIMQ
jgi:hypothetical protein